MDIFNDFDRLFIGIIKNDKSYLKTFVYNVNTIDKFGLQMKNKGNLLKIILKDKNVEEICYFEYNDKNELELFLFLINGKIEDINGKEDNSENCPPPTITSN